jgi:hypothetical protein
LALQFAELRHQPLLALGACVSNGLHLIEHVLRRELRDLGLLLQVEHVPEGLEIAVPPHVPSKFVSEGLETLLQDQVHLCQVFHVRLQGRLHAFLRVAQDPGGDGFAVAHG